MKIDNAIKDFSEKYDRESMMFIERLSSDIGLNNAGYKIDLFNIRESFENFEKYLKQYSEYKITYLDDPNASSREVIHESTKVFMELELFTPTQFKYADVPSFVTGYVEGVNSLLETIDSCKSRMMESGVELDAIGDVNDFTDQFMERLNELYSESMDKLLLASGYTNHKKFKNPRVTTSSKPIKEEAPVFL